MGHWTSSFLQKKNHMPLQILLIYIICCWMRMIFLMLLTKSGQHWVNYCYFDFCRVCVICIPNFMSRPEVGLVLFTQENCMIALRLQCKEWNLGCVYKRTESIPSRIVIADRIEIVSWKLKMSSQSARGLFCHTL